MSLNELKSRHIEITERQKYDIEWMVFFLKAMRRKERNIIYLCFLDEIEEVLRAIEGGSETE